MSLGEPRCRLNTVLKCILRYDAIQYDIWLPALGRNLLRPYLGYNTKMEEIGSSETLVTTCQSAR
jgi:hypothetical protein